MNATFFLSTGRCGTQSICKYIGEICKEAVVLHEPIGPFYYPRLTLGNFDINNKDLHTAKWHFEKTIKSVESGTKIIELGWTGFSWFERYKNYLGDKFGYIYLVRNPFNFAASSCTHLLYGYNPATSLPHNDYTTYAAIHPTDNAVIFPEISEFWGEMNQFDKCLYQWLEINAFAKKMHSKGVLPLATLKCEDLFFDDTTKNCLLEKIGIATNEIKIDFFDRFHNTVPVPVNKGMKPSCEVLLQKVYQMAIGLGYSKESLDEYLEKIDYSKPRFA